MNEPASRTVPLTEGEPAPWFIGRNTSNPAYQFSSVGGRYVVLSFFQSTANPFGAGVLAGFMRNAERFDDENICFFGVSIDPSDESSGRVRQRLPGFRYFWDFDLAISRLYGLVGARRDASSSAPPPYRRMTLVLDPLLRVLAVIPFEASARAHVSRVMKLLASQPPLGPSAAAAVQAPVLVVPRVFEPALCAALIRHFEDRGGAESGVVHEVEGKTALVINNEFKRRQDQEIEDEALRHSCMVRIHDRLAPLIEKAFQFRATRMERYIVACYDSRTGGFFRPHRDNTTRGTLHRKFAVTLNLNTGEYEGGDLRFPEFGRHTYRAPLGGAVVFSCSLLHEATPITRGRRYAFLPFLYDDAAARVREENKPFLDASITGGPDAVPGGQGQAVPG